MLKRFFAPRPAVVAGRALYATASEQARTPAFYSQAQAPDTVEGRFELYMLHVVLLVRRLRRHGDQATETSQAVFDAFVRNLDDALRDMGVGDLSVGKKMRKLGEAFYGRAKAYDVAMTGQGADEGLCEGAGSDALEALIARTLYADTAHADRAPVIARYVLAAEAELAAQPLDQLLAGVVTFPAFPPPTFAPETFA